MFTDYMEDLLGPAKWNAADTEAQFCCPFCQDYKTRFRINKNSLLAYCFNCDWRGNAVTFVREYQHLSWSEAFDTVNFYQDFKPLPDNLYDELVERLFLEDIEYEKKPAKLPTDFRLLAKDTSKGAVNYWKYAKGRLLTNRQIVQHGVGYCPTGEVTLPNGKRMYLKERLIIQVFDDDDQSIYWNARAITNKLKPKSLNPIGDNRMINKSDVLFNLNNAKKHGVAVITEGIFDATTIGDIGVCTFGKALAVKQLVQLIKAGIETVYIMLDPDAKQDAVKMASMLSKHFPNVFLCDLKHGDPNEVGRKGCLEAIHSAERFNDLTALRYKLLG